MTMVSIGNTIITPARNKYGQIMYHPHPSIPATS